MKKKINTNAHPGNRTPVSTVGGYYDTTTPDALVEVLVEILFYYSIYMFLYVLLICNNTNLIFT